MITGQGYIDEVKLRLSRYNVALKLGDAEILTYINDARRQVQNSTMMIYPERYAELFSYSLMQQDDWPSRIGTTYIEPTKVANAYVLELPTNIVNVEVAILQYTMAAGQANEDVTYRVEMRQANKNELFKGQMHSWNGATIQNPVYAMDRQMNRTVIIGNTYPWIMYIAGLDLTAAQTLFDIAHSIRIELWYIRAMEYIERSDIEMVIPPDMEEYVVYYTMLYCLQDVDDIEALGSVQADLDTLNRMLRENYETRHVKKEMHIPSKESLT